jgi:hypothetical protein
LIDRFFDRFFTFLDLNGEDWDAVLPACVVAREARIYVLDDVLLSIGGKKCVALGFGSSDLPLKQSRQRANCLL